MTEMRETKLREEILADARRKAERIINRAKREAEALRKEAQEEGEAFLQEQLEKAEAEAAQQIRAQKALLAQQKQRIFLERREAILAGCIEEAMARLRKIPDDFRQRMLHKLACEAVRCLSSPEAILYLRESDQADVDCIRIEKETGVHVREVRSDESIDAGVYALTPDGTRAYYNTFHDRLQRHQDVIRLELANILWQAEDKSEGGSLP